MTNRPTDQFWTSAQLFMVAVVCFLIGIEWLGIILLVAAFLKMD